MFLLQLVVLMRSWSGYEAKVSILGMKAELRHTFSREHGVIGRAKRQQLDIFQPTINAHLPRAS